MLRSHCFCSMCPVVSSRAGVCLLMHDVEPLKPSNTGWLIADLVSDTFAFGWSRTSVDAALLQLLDDPQWQPFVVFPGEFVEPKRVMSSVDGAGKSSRRPLFILLDATWTEARKMFRKSPYLDRFPVLSLQPEQLSRYRLRRSKREDHLCTAEVAALCLELAGDARAGHALDAYLDLFSERYLLAKRGLPVDAENATHAAVKAFL
ncbi:DTW domain-containing protein [Pseudomonas matsuisoli]|uniref:tRNA-uridine aminocarboxypropyltransferase n=1 Tax=Pseudomonas matsuisoli TaxID=1515666 RepID=A0A917PJ94_9PSED|nr:DTW domain-containing protein [Pseudomonas matsuisoli]